MCTETVQAAVQVQALLSDFELSCVGIHDGEVRNAIQAVVNAQPTLKACETMVQLYQANYFADKYAAMQQAVALYLYRHQLLDCTRVHDALNRLIMDLPRPLRVLYPNKAFL
jgi:hypothetical protein